MNHLETVLLQQDSRNKIKVRVPKADIEIAVKKVMRYRNTGKYGSYLSRLFNEGTAEFNDAIELLSQRYGIVE